MEQNIRPGLRPIRVKPDAPQLLLIAQPTYREQLIRAAIDRKGKKRS